MLIYRINDLIDPIQYHHLNKKLAQC